MAALWDVKIIWFLFAIAQMYNIFLKVVESSDLKLLV
jgi:hypothetical protein